jgi:integrase
MRLTTETIRTLSVPAGIVEKTFFDDDLAGFGLRMRATGSHRWVVQYDLGGKTKRITLGSPTVLTLGAARTAAKDLLAKIRLGADPAAERRKSRTEASDTFARSLPRYLAERRHDCRTSTWQQINRRLDKLARPLHPLPLGRIDRRTLADLLATVAADRGRSASTNLHVSLSGYFGWLVGEGLLDRNPMVDTNKPSPGAARDRVPSEDELRALWAALGDDDYGDIVRLVILCGSRRSEIGDLKWLEINFVSGLIEIPAARMKGGKAHVIPLSEPALDILRRRQRIGREYVFGSGQGGFSGWSAARRALDARLGGTRPDWTLHDFRRMASTVMNGPLGVQPHVVEHVLAHAQHGVAGTYNRWSYVEEKRAALELWADYVLDVVTSQPATAEVVPLAAKVG